MSKAIILYLRANDWLGRLCVWGAANDLRCPYPYLAHCVVYLPTYGTCYELTVDGLIARHVGHVYHLIEGSIEADVTETQVLERLIAFTHLPSPITNWTHWFRFRLWRTGNICTSFVDALTKAGPQQGTPHVLTPGEHYYHNKIFYKQEVTCQLSSAPSVPSVLHKEEIQTETTSSTGTMGVPRVSPVVTQAKEAREGEVTKRK